ncbi:MAG TPA: flippase [Bacteroidales bacterium]|nr:flippase [Bacteroidales bacterium]HPS16382.1 flippase [Bacteroidales bacterium]
MLKKARSILIHKDKKQIFSNFVSLSVLNGISFLFPLITVPYLTRVLGPSTFGLVSFANVVIQYFIIFTSFGFAFSATQQISINQNNKQKVSEIFSAVISVKLMISLLCALVLLILIVSFEQFRSNYILFIYTFGIVIGDALVPVWLFQGMEKMKFITIVNFISKLTFTLLIFVFVRNESDYLIVPLFNTYGYLIAGILSFIIAYKTFNLNVVFPKISEIKIQMKESWPIFVSTFSMNLYRNANVLLLGLFSNYTIVGYYSSAEKVIKGMQSIITPVSDALFPFMSKKFFNESNNKNANFLIKLGKYYFVILVLISLLFLVFARPVVTVFLGDKFIPSIPDMQIMSFVILFGGMNYFLGILGLVNMGYKKKFMVYVAITGVISIVNLFFLIYFFADMGASASMLISEIILFAMLTASVFKLRKISE